MSRFNKSFTQQEPIPDEAMERAMAVMKTGALHRYSSVEDQPTETALLETEFAQYLGQKYVLACTSGGYALAIALKAAGLQAGDKVLCNAYTLAPVPGAIDHAGGIPLLVETAADLTIDLDDLARKSAAEDVRFLMLSHMRGHIADMDRIMAICQANQLCLIEDAAHTMGANWCGKKSGTFGMAGCFSTQTYKHMNSGEGGFISTDDEQLMARAVIYSGSYMLFDKHLAGPDARVYQDIRFDTPNYSGRMDNLRAAILRPQLAMLDQNCLRWNQLYSELEAQLKTIEGLEWIDRPSQEAYVGSSIQFRLPGFNETKVRHFLERNAEKGVSIKWFGDPQPKGYTSRYDSWRYLNHEPLLRTEQILATTFDIRIPLTFEPKDCQLIGSILAESYQYVAGQ